MLFRFFFFTLLCLCAPQAFAENSSTDCPKLLNQTELTLSGETKNLCGYKNKVILVVNTASECGFTGQYSGLQKLYETYKDQNFVILGFPSNDFGGQEPGSNEDIKTFCKRNYGVTFPLFAKSSMKKPKENSFIANLIKAAHKSPSWNFNKYLISKDGQTVKHFGSMTSPTGKKLKKAIEDQLKAL